MVNISGENVTNKIKVTSSNAEYYSNLAEKYMNEAKECAELCSINTEKSQAQYEAMTAISDELITQKEDILNEITNAANDKLEDLAEAETTILADLDTAKTNALKELNSVNKQDTISGTHSGMYWYDNKMYLALENTDGLLNVNISDCDPTASSPEMSQINVNVEGLKEEILDGLTIMRISQSDYDALETKDENVMYVVVE